MELAQDVKEDSVRIRTNCDPGAYEYCSALWVTMNIVIVSP